MRKVLRFTLLLFTALLAVSLTAVVALAADANVTYSGKSGEFIFSPGSNYSPTDLFPDFKNVMPGDTLTQTITLKNPNAESEKIIVFLRSQGEEDGSSDGFLNQLKLTVKTAESTPFFDAKADETAGLTDWTQLGVLYPGGEVDLIVTLSVPTTLDNTYQDNIGKIKWQFFATEMPADESGWACPNCDEIHFHIDIDGDTYIYICDECHFTKEIDPSDIEGSQWVCPYCEGTHFSVSDYGNYILYKCDDCSYAAKYDRAVCDDVHWTCPNCDKADHFHIEDFDDCCTYVCDECSYSEQMVCNVCGQRMIRIIYKRQDNSIWYYYQCVDNTTHHSRPIPKTGDTTDINLWLILLAVSFCALCVLFIIVLVKKRKKKEDNNGLTQNEE